MMTGEAIRGLKALLLASCMTAAVLGGNALTASPAAAALPHCNVAFLSRLNVHNVTITSAADTAATATVPEFCSVVAAVATNGEGAGPGLANIRVQLPAIWNNRFLFLGCGGECGSINSTSAEIVDTNEAVPQGYAVVNTDTGHTDPTDAWTLLVQGVPNTPALTDFYYRAVHETTVAAKEMVEGYYKGNIEHSYFDGCSTGGRQALMAVDRNPEDFDGVIAGDPVMAFPETLLGHLNNLKIFAPMASYLPAATLTALDTVVKAVCDQADGIADGLAQNPGACNFDPNSLVADGTLTQAQATAFKAYLSAIKDTAGNLVFPGYSETDLATVAFLGTWTEEACQAIPGTGPDPWAAETMPGCNPSGPNGLGFSQPLIASMTELNANFDVWDDFPFNNGVVGVAGLKALRATIGTGSSDNPEDAREFLHRGGKLIMFHGFSDPSVSPYRSIWFYNGLANLEGGIRKLQKSARLFMVPGMGHCQGGPGPNTFDTLGALDAWVSRDVAPDAIVATNTSTGRTMPLCKYPELASYIGGDVNVTESWTCRASDKRLLKVGLDGGLAHAQAVPLEDDQGDSGNQGGQNSQ
jgi:feruloyl esterase